MKAMKLRLLVIGGINAVIALGLLASRGYADLYAGYLVVSLVVTGIGVLLKESDSAVQSWARNQKRVPAHESCAPW